MYLAELSFFSFFFLFLGRVAVFNIFRFFGRKGYRNTNVVIIADDASSAFIENLIARVELGYKIIVIFTDSEIIKSKFENTTIILTENFIGILNDLIKVDFVDEVLYLKENPDSATIREILKSCEDLGITLRLKSKDTKVNLSSAVRTDIADGKFLTFKNIPNNTYAMAIRKTVDINIALLAIIILFPVLVIVSLLIKLTSKGPLVCTYTKAGLKGQMITAYRFRTTYADAGYTAEMQESDADVSERKLTPVGRFLHFSGMDHLPQLFNVLRGEMPIIVQSHPLQTDNLQ
jgi:hypothetical protein